MSSKRALRRKACAGKQAHDSMTQAMAHVVWHLHEKGERLSAYRCRFCKRFHVGHMPARVRQSIRARQEAR